MTVQRFCENSKLFEKGLKWPLISFPKSPLMPLLLCVVIGPYSASCPFGGAMQANFLFQKFAEPIHK